MSDPPAEMRPDQVPHWVRRVESITVFVPAVIVWRGSSSATVRAVNVTSASMPRSAASTRTLVTRSGSTTSMVSGPIRVCDAILGHATRREHRTLDAVGDDGEGAVDDAPVGVYGHAGREVEIFGVSVEPEPVVVVRVTGCGMRDRQRRLVDRIVVERCQHARDRNAGRDRPGVSERERFATGRTRGASSGRRLSARRRRSAARGRRGWRARRRDRG